MNPDPTKAPGSATLIATLELIQVGPRPLQLNAIKGYKWSNYLQSSTIYFYSAIFFKEKIV